MKILKHKKSLCALEKRGVMEIFLNSREDFHFVFRFFVCIKFCFLENSTTCAFFYILILHSRYFHKFIHAAESA